MYMHLKTGTIKGRRLVWRQRAPVGLNAVSNAASTVLGARSMTLLWCCCLRHVHSWVAPNNLIHSYHLGETFNHHEQGAALLHDNLIAISPLSPKVVQRVCAWTAVTP
jgi:hypothetical protein